VILASGYDETQVFHQFATTIPGLSLNVEFLAKPFSAAQLKVLLAKYLGPLIPLPSHSPEQPPEGELRKLTVEEAERLLLAQLQDKNEDRIPVLRQLASLYTDTRRYDRAIACLREIMALEPDLEKKAACVLAMGANAEKQQDFEAAVRFYREAFAMEPTHNFVWYFINNNLGYSLNMLDRFAEGEQFCRAAIEIDPSRPNGHKNLGIALAGQGQYRRAAGCFITATYNNSGDARSFGLLKDLLQQHPELEFDFQSHFDRCEHAVKFAAAAIKRAEAGKPLKVLIGTNEPEWLGMCRYLLLAMTGGALEIQITPGLAGFIEKACAEHFDLGFITPMFLVSDQVASPERDPWMDSVLAVRKLKGKGRMALILAGAAEDIEKYADTCREAGVDEVLAMSFNTYPLLDAARRVLAQTGEQNDANAQSC
jgi:tetratricopeptide (TPR) repeat protein